MDRDAVDIFHPLTARWFRARFVAPTEAQAGAWPIIASGKHVLLSAPTGTGKTYSAFLYAIDQLVSGAWNSGSIQVVYVSPLKALNSDIRVNLMKPLEEISTLFREAGRQVPQILVQTRSGDTPEAERRRMLRRPPEILITTPESLNLILASPNARLLLSGLRTLIVDEIHSVLDSKRGTHLITAVERLVPLAGEFQRIGLSATVRPIETAAAFLGGFRRVRSGGGWRYEARDVAIVKAETSKTISLRVRYPIRAVEATRKSAIDAPSAIPAGAEPKSPGERGEVFWQLLAEELRTIISRRSSTLIFVNNRRLAERLTHEINDGQPGLLAYAHHGSLSREVRNVVEKRMKAGELPAIVATSSLELGIDIGDLDEVLLVETPMSVAAAVQRIGRAGHSVGETSSGTLFASHGMDLLRAAVVAPMVEGQEIEEVRPVICPLDVLAQVVLSMTAISPWKLDELYAQIRCSYPYQSLTRRQFDLVVEMLEGRYEESRIRELSARVSVDRIDGLIKAREGARYLLYSGGGTIPDRGYFGLHVRDSGAKIGELDEEFVWERRVGDAFVLGSQGWRIVAIDHQRVTVVPWKGSVNSSPFWKAERQLRSFHFSQRIGEALARWESVLAAGGSITRGAPTGVEHEAAAELERFLRLQRKLTGCPLPHRRHLLVEHTGGMTSARYLLIHTLWGGQVNEPLSLALKALLRRDFRGLDVGADNETIVIMLPEELADGSDVARVDIEGGLSPDGAVKSSRHAENLPPAGELLRRLADEDLQALISRELEASGFFGARFRENAGRALLLPRQRAGRRMPLWVTRLRAKRLLERVQSYDDFPIVAETWRECIRDDFDLTSLSQLLGEVRKGVIRVSEAMTPSPSPFASGIVWLQTNEFLYSDDTPSAPASRRGGSLTQELLREMVFTPELRVRIPRSIADRFEQKLQRTAPGYAPRDAGELVDWLKERLLIPTGEWSELLTAIERDGGPPPTELQAAVAPRIVGISFPGGMNFVAALEQRSRVERAFFSEVSGATLPRVLGEWLAFYSPIDLERLAALFGVGEGAGAVDRNRFERALDELCEEESLVRGLLLEGSEGIEICDAENMERLLSYLRRESAVSVPTRRFADLIPFLAEWQGVGSSGSQVEGDPIEERLPGALERLFGFPARAALWESDLLPARISSYRVPALDRLLRETELEWFGCGRETVSFRFRSDADLFDEAALVGREDSAANSIPLEGAANGATVRSFAETSARYTYWDLQSRSGLTPEAFTHELWKEVWSGRLSSDSFDPVRRGAMNGFRVPERRPAASSGGRRGAFSRWKSQTALAGTWYLTARKGESRDSIEELEISKDRARLLLERYGVLFRELLDRELPELRWGRLFRTLRLLELSGEIASGRYFDGIPGLQFASLAAVERLTGAHTSGVAEHVYWMNAVDPASPCGLGLSSAAALNVPSRLPSTHLVLRGSLLILVSKRLGLELSIRVPPDSPELAGCRFFFDALLKRDYRPRSSIKVERVNGIPSRESPYRASLVSLGFDEDFKSFAYRGGDNR